MSIEKDLGIDEALYHKCGLGLDYVEVEMLSSYIEKLKADNDILIQRRQELIKKNEELYIDIDKACTASTLKALNTIHLEEEVDN